MTNEEVAQRAYDVVLAVMQEGEATHAPGEWEGMSRTDHLEHAEMHLSRWWDAEGDDREDIENAAARCILALIVMDRESKEEVGR